MPESSYKIPGGKLVKVKLTITSGKITEVKVLGDFFLHPEETIHTIEDSLIGSTADEPSLELTIFQSLIDSEATLIGATAADIAKTIMMAWDAE
ncbi:MAG: lipoate protein ligase C-terminal domain-containing protein [Candidatus Thorarchaeota archaeon]